MSLQVRAALALALLLGMLTGCAGSAGRQETAMEWLESEYLKDPGRR